MNSAIFCELYEIMHNNEDFFLLGNLSAFPEFEKIAQAFKSRFIDISTCEHSALSLTCALASQGTLVILCVTVPHFMIRWYEDLILTIARKTLPIIIIGLTTQDDGTGKRISSPFRPELMLAYTIPGLIIVTPATRREMGTLLAQTCGLRRPIYIHFERSYESEIETSTTLPQLFEPIEYSHGTQAICIGIGSALDKAYQAQMLLENYGYSASLVSMHTVKPLNRVFLRKIMHSYSAIFTFEDQETSLGVGKIIGCFIAENKSRAMLFKSFGPSEPMITPGKFLPHNPERVFDMHAAGLELLDLLANSGIIPDHETWSGT